jgi:hypothetical protein
MLARQACKPLIHQREMLPPWRWFIRSQPKALTIAFRFGFKKFYSKINFFLRPSF